MRKLIILLLAASFSLVIFYGCAGSSSGKKENNTYLAKLGATYSRDFEKKSIILLNKYQYIVYRNEQGGAEKYIETEWKNRYPFADEEEKGVIAVKSRIILRSRPRFAGTDQELNRVEFFAETLVQLKGNPEWQRLPLTEMCRKYFKKFADDAKLGFNTRGDRNFVPE